MRGETVAWPPETGTDDQAEFVATCAAHHMAPLVYKQLSSTLEWERWPAGIRAPLKELALAESAVESVRERQLALTLTSLAARAVYPILLKGTALAYTHYPDFGLRPRVDTDFLIQEKDLAVTERVLAELGFVRQNAVSGEWVTYQAAYLKEAGRGLRHIYDFHWKVSNVQLFSGVMSYPELQATLTPVPALGPHARTLDLVHALLLACVHLVAHHRNSNHLIWLYDVHLLASHAQAKEWKLFVRLAREKRLRAVCAYTLKRACECFGTSLPLQLMRSLDANDDGVEMTAKFLEGRTERPLNVLLWNLRSLPHWRERLGLVKEQLFPPGRYMLNRYSKSSRLSLPLLYVYRALKGSRKLWRRQER
jgi:hypothetical protein